MFNITTSWWYENRNEDEPAILRNSKSAVLEEYSKSIVVLSKWKSRSLDCHVTSIAPCFYIPAAQGLGAAVVWTIWAEQLQGVSRGRCNGSSVHWKETECKPVGRWSSPTYECFHVPICGFLHCDVHCSYKVKDVHCHPGAQNCSSCKHPSTSSCTKTVQVLQKTAQAHQNTGRFLAAEAYTVMTSRLQSPRLHDLKLSQGCLHILVNRCIVDIPSTLNDMQKASCLELWKALQFFTVSLQHLCGKKTPSSWESSEIFCCSRAPNSALPVSAPLFI